MDVDRVGSAARMDWFMLNSILCDRPRLSLDIKSFVDTGRQKW